MRVDFRMPQTKELRASRVTSLFWEINTIAERSPKLLRDDFILPLANELWEISKYQMQFNELNHYYTPQDEDEYHGEY